MFIKVFLKKIIRDKPKILVYVLFCLLVSSCEKEEVTGENCFVGIETVREIKDKPAIITIQGSQYYIVEEGTIDTRLKPCNLNQEFQQNNLPVIISGEVKKTKHEGICCTDDFRITRISKR